MMAFLGNTLPLVMLSLWPSESSSQRPTATSEKGIQALVYWWRKYVHSGVEHVEKYLSVLKDLMYASHKFNLRTSSGNKEKIWRD
jgi:hypothetical protein